MRDECLPPPPMTDARDWILHVDLDQFLAAVQVLRHPALVGQPVVVGGDGDPTRPRQVVATRVVRGAGLRGPVRDAAAHRSPKVSQRRVPPVRPPRLRSRAGHVMAALRSLNVAVEQWGWDEACVAARTGDPGGFARRVQATVSAKTQLRCSVGIGQTKLQAKTATGFAKPGGVACLTRRTWLPVMGAEPVTALSGIGTRTATRSRARHHHGHRPRGGRPP